MSDNSVETSELAVGGDGEEYAGEHQEGAVKQTEPRPFLHDTMNRDALDAMARTVSHLLEMKANVSGGAARGYAELFALACRKVDEIAPVNVSKKAQDRANELGLGELRTYCWFCPIMSKHRDGPKRKRLFLWEHYKPVANIRSELLGLGPRPSLEKVAAILGTTRVAWVLRGEGDALGNRSRPDPATTYHAARVALLHPWEDCLPIDCKRHRSR